MLRSALPHCVPRQLQILTSHPTSATKQTKKISKCSYVDKSVENFKMYISFSHVLEACFMPWDMVFPGECSLHAWEECMFCCRRVDASWVYLFSSFVQVLSFLVIFRLVVLLLKVQYWNLLLLDFLFLQFCPFLLHGFLCLLVGTSSWWIGHFIIIFYSLVTFFCLKFILPNNSTATPALTFAVREI